MESQPQGNYKIKSTAKTSAWQAYKLLYFGQNASLGQIIKTECVCSLFGAMPGAAGLVFRKILFPALLGGTGRGNVFGRGITLRHPQKISLGNKCIVDDGVVLDAKGDTNKGISIGNNVYIGRNTIVYTKNGNITIEDNVNISANCQIFSSGDIHIGSGTMIAAFCYILNGGIYNISRDAPPFAQQDGNQTKGPTRIGENCWLAAHTTVSDGVTLGEHCVLGAGAVALKDLPAHTLCAGSPAKVIRNL
jgi:acetyltransferase-like isoleucine patch superfamily enzyme